MQELEKYFAFSSLFIVSFFLLEEGQQSPSKEQAQD